MASVQTEIRGAEGETSRSWQWPITYDSIDDVVVVADCLLILLVSILSGIIYHLIVFNKVGVLSHFVGSAAIIVAIFVPMLRSRGAYAIPKLLEWQWQIKVVILAWLAAFSFLFGVVFSLQIGSQFSRGAVLSFAFVGLFLLIASRTLWRAAIDSALKRGRLRGRKAIVIWDRTGPDRSDCLSELMRYGLRLEREYWYSALDKAHVLAREVIETARAAAIEEILIVGEARRLQALGPVLRELRALPVPVRFLPDEPTARLIRLPAYRFGQLVAVEFQRAPLSFAERSAKRVLDILVAVLGLILLMPLLLVVAAAIKIDCPGPALFRQTRRGFNGKPFRILKFRTMRVMDDGAIVRQASREDDRVTNLGWWLRRSSIDELPQLVNVLKGDMSLVGPRPHAAAHDNYYTKLIENYAFRHNVKPGITGWAQVNGHRGATPTVELMQQRIELDMWYINNWSLWLDIVIGMRTISRIMRAENAY